MKPIHGLLLTPLLATPAFAAEAGGGSSPSVFAGTIAQSIAAIIVFVILFLLLRRYAWKNIVQGLEAREGKIKGDLEQADKTNKKAATLLKQYQDQLAKAREESQRIIEKGRLEAERIAFQVQEEARVEMLQAKTHAEAEIKYAKEQALVEVFTQTARVSTDIAAKIIRRELKPEDQQTLVNESLADVAKYRRN